MKKTIFACLIVLLLSHLHSVEKIVLPYGGVHSMAGYQMVGFGVRSQKTFHGFDLLGSICLNRGFSPVIFHLKSLYLCHPKEKGLYFGLGLGLLNEPRTIGRVSGSFEGTLGVEWQMQNWNTVFLQADIIAPFLKAKTKVWQNGFLQIQEKYKAWPGATFGIGF